MSPEHELVCVWSGSMNGTYLGALKGVAPFAVKEMTSESVSKSAKKAQKIGALILRMLKTRGPQTQSQLASACNRAAGETRKALRRLADRGRIEVTQPCLFAMDPLDGQLWRVK